MKRMTWREIALPLLFLGLCGWTVQTRAEVVLSSSVQKIETGAPAEPAAPGAPGEEIQLVPVEKVFAGEALRYTIVFTNQGTQTAVAGSIVITNPLPEGTEYLDGSAAGFDTVITFSVDGENFALPDVLAIEEAGGLRPATAADYRSIRWTFEPELPAGESGEVTFDLRLQAL